MNHLRISLLSVILSLFAGISAFAARPISTQTIRIFDQELVIPNGGMTAPHTVRFTPPRYSDEARTKHIEGTVTVMAALDIDGNAKVLQVVKGLGHGLDENAVAAVEAWRFEPAYQNGLRVGVIVNVDVIFNLRQDEEARRALLLQFWIAAQNLQKKP